MSTDPGQQAGDRYEIADTLHAWLQGDPEILNARATQRALLGKAKRDS